MAQLLLGAGALWFFMRDRNASIHEDIYKDVNEVIRKNNGIKVPKEGNERPEPLKFAVPDRDATVLNKENTHILKQLGVLPEYYKQRYHSNIMRHKLLDPGKVTHRSAMVPRLI